jgi:hypothetical protein
MNPALHATTLIRSLTRTSRQVAIPKTNATSFCTIKSPISTTPPQFKAGNPDASLFNTLHNVETVSPTDKKSANEEEHSVVIVNDSKYATDIGEKMHAHTLTGPIEVRMTSRQAPLELATRAYYKQVERRGRVTGMDPTFDLEFNNRLIPKPKLHHIVRTNGSQYLSSSWRVSRKSEYDYLKGFVLKSGNFPAHKVFENPDEPNFKLLYELQKRGKFQSDTKTTVPDGYSTASLFNVSSKYRGETIPLMKATYEDALADGKRGIIATVEADDMAMKTILDAYGFKFCPFWDIHFFESVRLFNKDTTVDRDLVGRPAIYVPFYVDENTMTSTLEKLDQGLDQGILSMLSKSNTSVFNRDEPVDLKNLGFDLYKTPDSK